MKFNRDSPRASVRRRLLGGFTSILVAWLLLQVIMLMVFAVQRRPIPLWVDAMYFAIGSFPFVFMPEPVFFCRCTSSFRLILFCGGGRCALLVAQFAVAL